MILATLIYVRSEGHTLMIHKQRGSQRGKWNGLGGKFEPGETPEECARREVFEEAGLHAENLQLRGFITFPLFDSEHDWYVFVFTCTVFRGSLTPSDEGELHWVPNAALTDLNLHEGDRVFLPWLDQERLFSAKLVYENGRFERHDVTFYDLEAGGST